MVAPAPRPRGIRVRTALATEAEFISEFYELCDDTTIFAPTEKMKPIGADCAFSLELADGSPMVRGLGRIRNAWPTDDSPFGRPGIHIEIGQLTDTSKPIHAKLLAAQKAAKPRNRPAPSTHQLWGPPSGPPTEEMDALDEPDAVELPHRITKEIRGVAQPADEAETTQGKRFPDAVPVAVSPAREGTVSVAVVPAPVPQPRPMTAPASTLPPPAGSVHGLAVESTFDVEDALAASRPRPWWMNARVGGVFAAGIALGLLFSFAFRSDDSEPRRAAMTPPAAAAPAQVVAAAQPPQNCPPPAPAPPALAVVDEAPAVASTARERVTHTAVTPSAAPATKPAAKSAPAAVAKSAPATPAAVAKSAPATPAAVAKNAPAKVTAAAPKVATTAKLAPKPAATSKPAAKVATTTSRKPAPRRKGKAPCSSLDCI